MRPMFIFQINSISINDIDCMNSLLARVHVDMGKYQNNPTLAIYECTDIQAMLLDFIQKWKLPPSAYDQISLKIASELQNHQEMERRDFPSACVSLQPGKWQKSYIKQSIQQQKVCKSLQILEEIYSPILQLKPEFKHLMQGHRQQKQHKKFIYLRPKTQKKQRKLTMDTFRSLIQRKVRKVFLKLKDQNRNFLIPELISCPLTRQESQLLNSFFQSLSAEDLYSLDEGQFMKSVFERNFASSFYRIFT